MKLKLHLVMLALATSASTACAGDWLHWRGPEQNGVSREINLIDDWSFEPKKNLLWVGDVGGRSTPIVLNGRVYINTRTTNNVADPEDKIHAREQVVCYDAQSGKIVWRDVFNVFQTDIPAPRVGWASMAGDKETGYVYMHSVSGLFRCYTGDGKLVWEHSLFEDFGKISGYGGRTQTPIIDEDRVIVSFLCLNWGKTAVPPPKQTYYAFDKKTGEVQWISAPGGAPQDTNYSVPMVAVIEGTRMLIGGNSDGGVYAINARTGEPIWGFRMSKRGLNASPVVEGNRVYISHGEDNIDNTRFGRVQCIDATGKGDVTDTHGVWRVDDVKAGYTGLLVKDGILYVVADTGKMHAYDSKTGKELWVHALGTVGKGSPIWADGKIYVMEVNGNILIVKPSREKCETISHVQLLAEKAKGYDEIYASPAIADGKIFFVTRDRTICVGDPDAKAASDPIPPMGDETPPGNEVALIQLRPFETYLTKGGEVDYELHAFDKNGRFLEKLKPVISAGEGLPGATISGSKVSFGEDAEAQAGLLTAKHGELTAQARLRVFAKLPWKWGFDGYTGKQVPQTWVNAFLKLVPMDMDGDTVLKKTVGKGRPSAMIWLGPAEMSGYTVQADVMMKEEKFRMASIGITCQRYNLILKGNHGKLSIQSWAPHLRMAKEIRYRSDPDVWYTLKMTVEVSDEGARVLGKVWKRGEDEPEEWTLEAMDPHPNTQGSPGLYTYAIADCYFDNVIVTND